MHNALIRLALFPLVLLLSLLLMAVEARAQHSGGSFGLSSWGSRTVSSDARARPTAPSASRPAIERSSRVRAERVVVPVSRPAVRPSAPVRLRPAPTPQVEPDADADEDAEAVEAPKAVDLSEEPLEVVLGVVIVAVLFLAILWWRHRRSRSRWDRF